MDGNNKGSMIVNTIWAFKYCPCIHESVHGIVSLHKTKRGAEIAMEFHRDQERRDHEEMYSNLSISDKSELYLEFGITEDWCVV